MPSCARSSAVHDRADQMDQAPHVQGGPRRPTEGGDDAQPHHAVGLPQADPAEGAEQYPTKAKAATSPPGTK